ncbi:hypothetical protein [Granulicella mallensis]|jgi:hypothetical protein|uniref:Uncharacterized protein n=1 Tax=Granulicella mallensis TaxID=940614 RepID=A0A7W7ZKT7_9BACT|nr:hypothetical protein [Granulicella mallensis]MBB5061732.1 hypothetical protein [Granulicella mallensis]
MDPDVDIQKFAEKLVKAGREGVAWERKKLEWILEEKEKQQSEEKTQPAKG